MNMTLALYLSHMLNTKYIYVTSLSQNSGNSFLILSDAQQGADTWRPVLCYRDNSSSCIQPPKQSCLTQTGGHTQAAGVLAKGLMFPQGAEWDRLAPLTEQTTTRWTRSTEEQLVSRAGLSVTASVNCGFLASCNPDIPASPLHWEDGMTNSWSSFCRWTGVVFTDETTDDKLNK